jgi:hypothetical protein
MKLSQFKSLSGKEKFMAIEKMGELIAEREVDFNSVALFQLNDFYVELYRHQHFNVITKMKSFENTDFLEPYFQNMPIDLIMTS